MINIISKKYRYKTVSDTLISILLNSSPLFSILTFLYLTEQLLVSADGVVRMPTADSGPIAADTIHNKK